MLSYRKKTTWPYLLAVVLLAGLLVRIPSDLWFRFTKHNDPAAELKLAWVSYFSKQVPANEHAPHREVLIGSNRQKGRAKATESDRHGTNREPNQRRAENHQPTTPFRVSAWPNDRTVPVSIPSPLNPTIADRPPIAATEPRTDASPVDFQPPTVLDPPIISIARSEPTKQIFAFPSLGDSETATSKVETSSPRPSEPNNAIVDPQNAITDLGDATTVRRSAWPRPTALLTQLDALHGYPINDQIADWIGKCTEAILKLEQMETINDPAAETLLDEIEGLAIAPSEKSSSAKEDHIAAEVRRSEHALVRRVAIWKATLAAARANTATATAQPNLAKLTTSVQQLRSWLMRSAETKPWVGYLMLDRLKKIPPSPRDVDLQSVRQTAREALSRIESDSLSDAQKRFLADPNFKPLRKELLQWAPKPVELSQFLNSVEEFETSCAEVTATCLVEQIRDLRWSQVPERVDLGGQTEFHYRNANLRIAISESLLNALLPVVRPTDEGVRDQVLGASVRGRNSTWTQLGIRLVPDEHQIRVRLVANGATQSRTVAQKGPVRVFSRGNSNFSADKEIVISANGVRAFEANADANGAARTTDIKTDYDQFPLLGWVVRQMVIDEQEQSRGLLRAHVRNRVTSAAKNRLNDAVASRLDGAEKRVADRVIQPLQKLDLGLKAVEMRTTQDRVILRCRLAGSHQLAAFTPRPRAIAGSLFEAQVHQSTVNNLLQQAELSGKRIELEELIARLRDRLGLELKDIDEDIPEDVFVKLADGQPMRVEFDDDRVQFALRISELTTPKRKWKNFEVRARYRADASGTHVDLQRDGGIELSSEAIAFRDQVALRGIFTKVMSRNHRLQILRGRFEQDPRLAKLDVVQFVSRDGWIGLSIATRQRDRIARDANLQRR